MIGTLLAAAGAALRRRFPASGSGERRPRERRTAGDAATEAAPARDLAAAITAGFRDGSLDLAARAGAPAPGWDAMPEFRAAAAMRRAGASGLDVRLALTFGAAMDRARDSDRLWDAVAAFFAARRWAFSPEEVSRRPFAELCAALRAAGVSQRHGDDCGAWRTIAASLLDPASPAAVRRAVFEAEGDARELVSAAQRGRWFPLLRGPKISVMWVRMLAAPGGAAVANLDALPVAVDTQVRKVTEHLGVIPRARDERAVSREAVQRAWRDAADAAVGPPALAGTGAALDPALWFFGKWGCTFCVDAGRRMPIAGVCRARCRFGAREA